MMDYITRTRKLLHIKELATFFSSSLYNPTVSCHLFVYLIRMVTRILQCMN